MPELASANIVTTATENECGVEHRFTLDGTWNDEHTEFSAAPGQVAPCTWPIVESCTIDGQAAEWAIDEDAMIFALL